MVLSVDFSSDFSAFFLLSDPSRYTPSVDFSVDFSTDIRLSAVSSAPSTSTSWVIGTILSFSACRFEASFGSYTRELAIPSTSPLFGSIAMIPICFAPVFCIYSDILSSIIFWIFISRVDTIVSPFCAGTVSDAIPSVPDM